MEYEQESPTAFEADAVAEDEMNWDAYAEHYDRMCELNPAYQHNIDTLVNYISKWDMPNNPRVCDLGAGTGNYIASIAEQMPGANFVHVDFDVKMNELAARKYAAHGLSSVEIISDYVQEVNFPEEQFDLLICINALYAISPQEIVLSKIHSWLKPEGKFFIIDFGRKQRTIDWTMYMFRESMKSHKVGQYVKTLMNSRELIKQNNQTSKGQDSGRYWLHSTREFQSTLTKCGFKVEEAYPCYRGYADLAVCGKGQPQNL